ncbi:hypothetical protein M5K25_004830 [Dendrobium thyrsiflorum]|uniref:DUF4283 domain-containing protein n=1 Tax=Dendrobium thyrsiflorum TaxID=117978 RepID=A0ABD0VN78_DENTH
MSRQQRSLPSSLQWLRRSGAHNLLLRLGTQLLGNLRMRPLQKPMPSSSGVRRRTVCWCCFHPSKVWPTMLTSLMFPPARKVRMLSQNSRLESLNKVRLFSPSNPAICWFWKHLAIPAQEVKQTTQKMRWRSQLAILTIIPRWRMTSMRRNQTFLSSNSSRPGKPTSPTLCSNRVTDQMRIAQMIPWVRLGTPTHLLNVPSRKQRGLATTSPLCQPSQASPLQPRGVKSSPFPWNKVQFIKLDKMLSEIFLAKDGMSMEPKVATVHDNIAKLDWALMAKLMGQRVAFFPSFLVSSSARDMVLMNGPWIIAGNIIGMDKWSPTSSPSSLHGLQSPIWIQLPQLHLMYWDTNNITRLANMLGEPLWMDSHKSTWGRSSYARICVRIDLYQKLQSGLPPISPKAAVAPATVQATPVNFPQASPPIELKHKVVEEPLVYVDKDESPLGAWNLVSRRRKGKLRAPKGKEYKLMKVSSFSLERLFLFVLIAA